MKKVLLAGTALAAAGFISTQAFAEVSVSGFGAVIGTVASQKINGEDDETTNISALQNDFEIIFNASSETSVGTVSAKVEMEAGDWFAAAGTGAGGDGASGADEASITLSGGWGSLTLGTEDGADDVGSTYYAGYVTQRGMYDWNANYLGMAVDQMYEFNDTDTSDANKITYRTPDMGGASVALSHTPAQENTAILVGFDTQAGGADVGVIATYAQSSDLANDDQQDANTWSLSAKAGMAGATLVAYYGNGEQHDRDEVTVWSVGASYDVADVTLRAQYGAASNDQHEIATDIEQTDFALGVSYNLGGGATAFLSYHDMEHDDKDTAETEAERQTLTAGLAVSF